MFIFVLIVGIVIAIVIYRKQQNTKIQKAATASTGYQVATIKPKDEILAAINSQFGGWRQVNGAGELNLQLPNSGVVIEFYISEVGNNLYSLRMRAVEDVSPQAQLATFPLWYDMMKQVDKIISR